jgi:hypothetical protein
MYKGTMTVESGGMSSIADVGRETFGVNPGVPPGVAGFGFLFWRILRNSLKRPMINVGPALARGRRTSLPHGGIGRWTNGAENVDLSNNLYRISSGGVVFIGVRGSRRTAVCPIRA